MPMENEADCFAPTLQQIQTGSGAAKTFGAAVVLVCRHNVGFIVGHKQSTVVL